ncbi:substrate-binding and vWA domain-containing protein [Deinococcus aquiradiocola]|uniref:VWA domain-containing protein n=1 Tax=Deinococcus aquiradiocola TaxID=393059 RepID=A0A917P498_9DEIO|nr:VWA domain-containing protein [Deinococcus aquiradiocola]GGJ60885.1 VWA domain-containing protein [Deinococcus aquiradiocola]
MKRAARPLALLLLPLALAACRGGGDATTLTVLGGSELSDLKPILDDVARQTGVKLDVRYTGTLDGTEQLLGGARPDLVWFSSARYLQLQNGLQGRVLASEKIMLSPVVLGVKASSARRWGWTSGSVSWKDIAQKAASGDLKYGMANPAASNSGLSALIGVVAAVSGKGDAITAADVTAPALRGFFRGQALTSGSSGWLSDAYLHDQDRLNGLINYESVLLSLNASGKLREPLTLIYPKDGLITADYPLMLLNKDRQDAYQKLVDALKSTDVQRRILQETRRRPVNRAVPLTADFPAGLTIELPFPGSGGAVNAVLNAYLQDTRTPANTIFVLDTSGSMGGQRMEALKAALLGLSGADGTLTGRFSNFANRERVTFIPFSSGVQTPQTTEIGPQKAQALTELQSRVQALQPGGGTNIYGALEAAYAEAAHAPPGRYTSIVLMTDGESNEGPSARDFRRAYDALPGSVKAVRTFTILFGDASRDAMNEIATLTGGRTFDGTSDLQAAFKQIRGYQ